MQIPGLQPATAPAGPPANQPAARVSSPPKARVLAGLEEQDSARLYGLDEQDAPPRVPAPRGRPCPKCAKPLPSADATFCVDCGYNLKTGKVSSLEVVKPVKLKKRKPSKVAGFFASRLTSGKFLGGLASLIGGGVWLVLGLMANRIFFYPIILIIGGLFSVLTGLISGDE